MEMETNRSFIFESGFPGFPGLRKFRLEWDEALAPLEWLISIENPDIRFIVVNPMFFKPDYAPNLKKEHMDSIGIKKKEDLRILAVVTLKEDYEQSTVNLASPLMFNMSTGKAVQLLIDDGVYSHVAPIFAEEVTC